MSIGKRIVLSRERKGWNQRELARRVNINVSVMNRIELGDRPVKDHELAKLAEVLEVPSDYLLGISENPQTKNEQSKGKGFDSLAEIQAIVDDLGIDSIGFFDIEKWKDLSPEDVEDIKKHFEWIAHKARERKKEEN